MHMLDNVPGCLHATKSLMLIVRVSFMLYFRIILTREEPSFRKKEMIVSGRRS